MEVPRLEFGIWKSWVENLEYLSLENKYLTSSFCSSRLLRSEDPTSVLETVAIADVINKCTLNLGGFLDENAIFDADTCYASVYRELEKTRPSAKSWGTFDLLLNPDFVDLRRWAVEESEESLRFLSRQLLSAPLRGLLDLIWHSKLPCYDALLVPHWPLARGVLKKCVWKGKEYPCHRLFHVSITGIFFSPVRCTYPDLRGLSDFQIGAFAAPSMLINLIARSKLHATKRPCQTLEKRLPS